MFSLFLLFESQNIIPLNTIIDNFCILHWKPKPCSRDLAHHPTYGHYNQKSFFLKTYSTNKIIPQPGQ